MQRAGDTPGVWPFPPLKPGEIVRISRECNSGGGSGIRTHDTVSRIHAFQASAFSHSAIPPRSPAQYSRGRRADNPRRQPGLPNDSAAAPVPKPASPRRSTRARTAANRSDADIGVDALTARHQVTVAPIGLPACMSSPSPGYRSQPPAGAVSIAAGKRLQYRPCTDPSLRQSRFLWPFRQYHQKPE
jgi:hypothetical protein